MFKLLAAAGLYQPGCTGWCTAMLVVAFSSPMSPGVTLATERDEIQLGIFARMAAKFLMVNLQVRHRAARLTPPAIAPQNLLPQTVVRRTDPAATAAGFGPVELMRPSRSGLQGTAAAVLRAGT